MSAIKSPPNKLWLTYAWVDNEQLDVDHIISMLRKSGLEVNFDRQQIIPGRRLWQQIDRAISDPSISDAWAIVATENSLHSEACIEELAYALDRALRTRGGDFPLIGIFPQPIDQKFIPSALSTRLYVNLRDPNWAEQVSAGVRGVAPSYPIAVVSPYVIQLHRQGLDFVLELRRRTGRWYPFTIAVRKEERQKLRLVSHGPSGVPPTTSIVSSSNYEDSNGGRSGIRIHHAIDPLNSAYAHFSEMPSVVLFGDSESGFIVESPGRN